jgi:hypothetical protein
MRKSSRIVGLLCGVGILLSVFAGPATAEFENKHCKQVAAAWKKKHSHATLRQKIAEAEKLTTSDSCNFTKNPKAL